MEESRTQGESTQVVSIVADDRESSSGVLESLRQIPGIELNVRRLTTADFIVDGQCLFERKTIADFAQSIVDGRVFRQANRMSHSLQPFALILEGTSRDLASLGVRREALQGAMISLSLIFGTPILRALNCSETAHLLVYAGRQLQRQRAAYAPSFVKRPKRRRRIQLRLLQGLPGIGPARAADLLDHFGSVHAVIGATEEALQQVKGIGPQLAAGICWALEAEPGCPRSARSPR